MLFMVKLFYKFNSLILIFYNVIIVPKNVLFIKIEFLLQINQINKILYFCILKNTNVFL